MSLGSKIILSSRGVHTGHAVDADSEVLLWIDYEKIIFTLFEIIQDAEVNSLAFPVVTFSKQTEKLWKSESYVWHKIYRDNTHVD